MPINTYPKYRKLVSYLSDLGNAAVAFSGGVDSTFLLKAAVDALGDKVIALTVKSPYIPEWEVDEAVDFARRLGVKHLVIESPLTEEIIHNPENRCYLCKRYIFKKLWQVTAEKGFSNLLDGTNSDDSSDSRPGMKALKELNVLSPLKENGFGKKDIRRYSKILGLPTWEKPAYACLLTRIPYNTGVEDAMLTRIEKAEKFLIDSGIKAVRVRVNGDMARIEVDPSLIKKVIEKNRYKAINQKLKDLGFKYVTLDLGGYRENK
jgi:pyridinium-3,5-biscarboxylic acid mononucleotide sulfurtransferase